MTDSLVLFDFTTKTPANSWQIVDDGVMGGRSAGKFFIHSEGHGVFEGKVSLENNGGFSSVRHGFQPKSIAGYTRLIIHLKGDGKRYQVRLKSSQSDYHSYIAYIDTQTDWQTVEILLSEMYPSFRGQRLNRPNYAAVQLSEIAFLIGNKKAEDFQLMIDKIVLK
ncbi:MAG: CIA30 family protein [Bernardetiaceae bacterium]|nr:CIA30 family protein [Bernardetiaceae bacterium]